MAVRRLVLPTLVAVVVVSACGPAVPTTPAAGTAAATAKQIRNLTIALPSLSATSATLQIAEREGFNARRGLDVEFTLHSGGPPALQALVAGAAEGTIPITGTVINAYANGADVIIVAGSQGHPDYELYARAGITSAKAPAGEKIATAEPGSEYKTKLQRTLLYSGGVAAGYDP